MNSNIICFKKHYITIILSFIFLSSCNFSDKGKDNEGIIPALPENDIKLWNLRGKVYKITEEMYSAFKNGDKWEEDKLLNRAVYTFNKMGFLEDSKFYAGNGNITSENSYKYNDRGYKAECITRTGDKTENIKYSHIFNEKGLVIQTSTFNNNSETKVLFEYDSSSNLIKSIRIDEKGNIDDYSVFKYDRKNRLTETKNFDKNGKIKSIHIQEYINSEYVSDYKWFDNTNKLKTEYKYEYDKYGNKIKVCSYSPDSQEVCSYSEYTYDNEDNWIRALLIQEGKEPFITKRRIEYF